jgi:hypothetical protein
VIFTVKNHKSGFFSFYTITETRASIARAVWLVPFIYKNSLTLLRIKTVNTFTSGGMIFPIMSGITLLSIRLPYMVHGRSLTRFIKTLLYTVSFRIPRLIIRFVSEHTVSTRYMKPAQMKCFIQQGCLQYQAFRIPPL